MLHESFLQYLNSVLSSGQVPGLYTSQELDTIYNQLRDAALQESGIYGLSGGVDTFFTHNVRQNLHVVLVLLQINLNFKLR